MPRDYKNSGRKKKASKGAFKRKKRSHFKGWLLLFSCMLMLGLLGFYIYYNKAEIVPEIVSVVELVKEEAATQKEPGKPRFDFYTLLPEMKVTIPDAEIKKEQQRLDEKERGIYLLQVGSFRAYDDADSLKAQLAFLGIESEIQSVSSNGEEWQRVRAGPFDNKREMNKARNRLHSNDIDTLLIRVKN